MGTTVSLRFRTRSYAIGDVAIAGDGTITGKFISVMDILLLGRNKVYLLDPAARTGKWNTSNLKCTNYTDLGDILENVIDEKPSATNTTYQTKGRYQTWKIDITPGLIRVYLRNDDTETTFTLIGSAAYTCSFNPAGEDTFIYVTGIIS